MAIIAWRLPPQPIAPVPEGGRSGRLIEWRVLILSFTLFLYSFGYGGITSFTALYADANGVTPKGIYLTALAVVILVTRPLSGRLGDRFGYRRVFLPCLVLITLGLACLVVRRDAVLAGDVGGDLRRRLRHGVPGVRRLRHAARRRRPPRRRVRRHPRVLRHRHRHRLDQHGLDHRPLRLRGRLRHRRRAVSARVAVFSVRRPASARIGGSARTV